MTNLVKMLLILFASLPFSANFAFAEEGEKSVPEQETDIYFEMSLEELLNTEIKAATKTKITHLEVPQAITVLNRNEIERSPANNLAELLQTVVGANVVRVQSSQNVLGARGSNAFTPSKILILIDGQAIDPTLFSTTWWELVPISLSDIERIEFIKSPGTIYGANAQNGVVNIITRTISPDQSRGDNLSAQVKYGEQNMRQAYLGYLGRRGGTSFRVSTEFNMLEAYENSDRLEIVPGKLSPQGEQTLASVDNQLSIRNFSGSFQTPLLGNVLTAGVGYKDVVEAQGRVPDRLCFVAIDGLVSYAYLRYDFASFGADHQVSLDNNLINYSFNKNSDSDALAPAEMQLNKLNLEYELKKTVIKHNLLFGASYSLETASNASGVEFFVDEEVKQEPLMTSHLQDEWIVTAKDHIYIGAFYSNHYISGSSISPLLAYVHKFNNKNSVRVASFTSQRNPNLFEHSMDYDQTTGKSSKRTRIVSNVDLNAEKTTSYEIGFRSQPMDRLFFSTDFYLNKIKNGIEWTLVGVDTVPNARPRYQSENSLEQTIRGAEIVLKYFFNSYVSLENNFDFVNISNKSSRPEYQGAGDNGPNGVGEGRYGAEYVPPFAYNATLRYNQSRFHSNLQLRYVAKHTWQWPSWDSATGQDKLSLKPVPAYTLFDAHLGVDITENIGLAVEGVNLFNKLHAEWRGDKSYFGRMFWFRLNVDY